MRFLLVVWLCLPAGLSGCAAVAVGSAAVGTVTTAGTVAVKGAVGATKLAVKGTGATIRAGGRAFSSDAPCEDDDRERRDDVDCR